MTKPIEEDLIYLEGIHSVVKELNSQDKLDKVKTRYPIIKSSIIQSYKNICKRGDEESREKIKNMKQEIKNYFN